MKPLLLAALLALSACATITTPERCETALRAADRIESAMAVLIRLGIEPEKAAAISKAVLMGHVAVEMACATGAGGR